MVADLADGSRSAALRAGFVGAALFVFTDGPLFFLSNNLLGRPDRRGTTRWWRAA